MTQQEIALLLEMMLNAYPMAANKIANPDATIQAWELAFGDEPSDRVYKAARHHMNTSKFFPTVADIRQAMNKGQLLYGDVPEGSQRAIEAPEAPKRKIVADVSEEAPCNYERCILYHDLCNGLEDGKCPFEGI